MLGFGRLGRPQRIDVVVEFRAPLDYVYRWCTDYTPNDPKLEGEKFRRRILSKTRRGARYEDLEETPTGFWWTRVDVRFAPPDRWTMTSWGNYRSIRATYRLTPLSNGGTRLKLRILRRPGPLTGVPRTVAWRRRSMGRSWANYRRALEAEYRRTNPKRRGG